MIVRLSASLITLAVTALGAVVVVLAVGGSGAAAPTSPPSSGVDWLGSPVTAEDLDEVDSLIGTQIDFAMTHAGSEAQAWLANAAEAAAAGLARAAEAIDGSALSLPDGVPPLEVPPVEVPPVEFPSVDAPSLELPPAANEVPVEPALP